ncbi:MAG: DUF4214 domain-containing protein, partial [Pseudomonadota bacterium]
NDKLHDHWVDILGTMDTVMDFDRSEGDRIVIEGHTTQIAGITYGDINGDGIMDHSVIELYSDQGKNGGAHNDDRLGEIRVYGDLVKDSDIETTAAPAYGIVHTIDDLREAVTPLTNGTNAPDAAPPSELPLADALNIKGLPIPVLALPGHHQFAAAQRAPLVLPHSDAMDLVQGTIAFNFVTDQLVDHQVLFSKDAKGYVDGGHITAYLNELGDLTVRVQDQDESFYLKAQGLIDVDRAYDFALSFGEHGVELMLDGQRVALMRDVVYDLSTNEEYLVVGASGWNNTPGQADRIHSHFNGTISDFVVFDEPISAQDLRAAGFGNGEFGTLGSSGAPLGQNHIYGSDGPETILGTSGDDHIIAETMNSEFDEVSAQLYRLYQATLGRDPDLTGLMHWHAKLNDGEITMQEISERFVASPEFAAKYGDLDHDDFVTLLYQNVLNRTPDAVGFEHWTGFLERGERDRADVVERFAQSQEFVSNTELDAMDYSQALLKAEFSDDVFRLYQATLGRTPDTQGFENWIDHLASGMPFVDAVAGFMGSREFQQTYGVTDDSGFIDLLYENILDRPADPLGEQTWTSRLESGDWSREDVVAAMAQSPEFQNKSLDDLIDWMRAEMKDDVIEPGAGDNLLLGGMGSDVFVFAPTEEDSTNQVIDLEAWDLVDLQAFGYATADEALSKFAQDGDSVVFSDANVQIAFENTDLSMVSSNMLLI